MDDFSSPGLTNGFGLAPSESNYIEPFKRPLSSMAPTIIFRSNAEYDKDMDNDEKDDADNLGSLFMVVGASGGPKIITATLQAFLNFGLIGKSLFSSIAAPRIHNQLLYKGEPTTVYEQ